GKVMASPLHPSMDIGLYHTEFILADVFKGTIPAALALIPGLLNASLAVAQAEGAQAPAKSGQEAGSPHPVQLDAQHRPITAGGFVKDGPIVFEDASEKTRP